MSSAISWTDETWNVLAGCTPVSDECMFCYAAGASLAPRLANHPHPRVRRKYDGVARLAGDGRAVFTGTVNADLTRMGLPLRWGKPRRVFVNSMSDLYHDQVSSRLIAAHFAIMAASPDHLFQVLTKRPERQRRVLRDPRFESAVQEAAAEMLENRKEYGIQNPRWMQEVRLIRDAGLPAWPLPNVVLGTSVGRMAALGRIPELLATPAALRFISMEPLLERITLPDGWWHTLDCQARTRRQSGSAGLRRLPCTCEGGIHQLAIGGESNQRQPDRARPMDPEWVRHLLRQAEPGGVLCHVKQMGTVWARVRGLRGQGTDPTEWPEDLRVQQDLPMPQPAGA